MPDYIVIADTSCLIALAKADSLFLLNKLYENVHITKEIAEEFGEELPDWIQIENAENKTYQQILSLSLDLGEASAIALALEKVNALLILDDLRGRKEAEKLGLRITGTLGVLIKSKSNGLIEKIKPSLERLKVAGFRIAPAIEEKILKHCNEY